MTVDKAQMRAFSGAFTTGMAVVTAYDGKGHGHGLTLNAVAQVSVEPPLYLASIAASSTTLAAIRETGAFCVHFLGRDQEDVAKIFASKSDDKFVGLAFRQTAQGPFLDGVIAAAQCTLAEAIEVAGSVLVIGTVESAVVHDGQPLIYHQGAFTGIGKEKNRV